MLVLTRKLNESIVIISTNGELVTVGISRVDNERVKLGIEAPQNVKIFRKEVYESILESNADAQCNIDQLNKQKIKSLMGAMKLRKQE